MRIEMPSEPSQSPGTLREGVGLARLSAAAGDPELDVLQLIETDIAIQRYAANKLRACMRREKQAQLERSLAKLEQAGKKRIWTAGVSAALKVVSSVVGGVGTAASSAASQGASQAIGQAANEAIEQATRQAAEQVADQVVDRVACRAAEAGLAALADRNPMDRLSEMDERAAQRRRMQSDSAAEMASDTQDWLQAVRELERRLVDRLEALQAADHQANLQAISR